MITAALLLSIYNLMGEWNAAKASADAWNELAGDMAGAANEFDSGQVPDYVLNPEMDMPEKEIDGQSYIGMIEIPAIEISLPVISEWNYPGLKVAPCRYSGSAYLDNMTIAAHNYEAHFGKLKKLNTGDEVTFTDMDGNVFRYEVAVVEILQPTAIEEMTCGEYPLSLFTCTIGGQYRVTVRCEKIV